MRTKREKRPKNLKFEICLTHDRDVHMRLQIFKVSLKILMSYFYKSRGCREIFVMIIKGSLEFDLILLQL